MKWTGKIKIKDTELQTFAVRVTFDIGGRGDFFTDLTYEWKFGRWLYKTRTSVGFPDEGLESKITRLAKENAEMTLGLDKAFG